MYTVVNCEGNSMKLKQIFKEDFPNNKKEVMEYSSDYYYKLNMFKKPNNMGWIFDWEKTPFKETFYKKWKGVYFEAYKTNAEYYILENDNQLEMAIVIFEYLPHSRRTRIWDIMVQPEYQRRGLGTYLLSFVEKKARTYNSRALVVECQNTNTKAIDFYLKFGFELIGFDLEAYTKEQSHEVEIRFEMGKKIQ